VPQRSIQEPVDNIPSFIEVRLSVFVYTKAFLNPEIYGNAP
jgi:hypothetical protein